MRVVRHLLTGMIFLVACPLSWLGAWVAGTWFTFLLSLLLPTYGAIYWGLKQVMPYGFLHGMLSWGLAPAARTTGSASSRWTT